MEVLRLHRQPNLPPPLRRTFDHLDPNTTFTTMNTPSTPLKMTRRPPCAHWHDEAHARGSRRITFSSYLLTTMAARLAFSRNHSRLTLGGCSISGIVARVGAVCIFMECMPECPLGDCFENSACLQKTCARHDIPPQHKNVTV